MPSYTSSDDLDAEERETFINEEDAVKRGFRQFITRSNTFSNCTIMLAQGVAILSLVLYLILKRGPTDAQCARQLSPYSPYLEDEKIEFEEFTDSNHFMQPSKYRGHPTPELEEAWLDLWKVTPIGFPESRLRALNKTNTNEYARASREYGGGIMGFLDMYHQLHCLNMVRQYTYRNEYNYSNVTAFVADEEVLRAHIDHCIEIIRKAIICTGDVTPILFITNPERSSGKVPEFNVPRKCRKEQKIRSWISEHKAFDDRRFG